MSVNIDQTVISDKFKYSDEGFKYFVGYQEGEIFKPLCPILPQMSGYINHFKNSGKNRSFLMKDDKVWEKYNEKIILKAKVKEFDGVITANLSGNEVQGKNMHYTCIACMTVDSVMRMDKKTIRRFI